jgi:uncharacterized integral membrane protein (TIGR00698 family)
VTAEIHAGLRTAEGRLRLATREQQQTRRTGAAAWLQRLAPGLLLAAGLGVLAWLVAEAEASYFGHALVEALVLALLFGVAGRHLIPRPAPFVAGTAYAAKPVLELGVGLLGASIDLRQVTAAGPALLCVALAGVVGGILVNYLIGRGFRLSEKLAVLVAVGNAICGNSAIAAVAPVIRAEKKDVASAIALTAVLGVCLVVALPLAIEIFRLSDYQYGVLAGMSVYAVPQVLAAAFPVSELAGEVATLVKLTRVMLLGPVVIGFALLYRARGDEGEAKRGWNTYVPWFVALFFLLAALRSTGVLGAGLGGRARDISRLLTILAMAGLGFGVELASVRHVGPRVGAAVVCSLLFMAALTLILIRLVGIDG